MYDLNEYLEAEKNNLNVCEQTQRKNKKLIDEDLFHANISQLILFECDTAINEYGYFKNYQEFIGTIKEEIDEMNDEVVKINEAYGQLWRRIKQDADNEDIAVEVKNIINRSMICMAEVIQVHASCMKLLKSEARRKKK